jgi:hypothetical protein
MKDQKPKTKKLTPRRKAELAKAVEKTVKRYRKALVLLSKT